MDVLKQLEAKLQTLVQQRNELKDEVARLRAAQGEEGERLRALEAERDALKAEREELRGEVERILRMVEGL